MAEGGRRAATALIAAADGAGEGAALAVAHGLVLQAAVRRLASVGAIAARVGAPHLGNGRWMALDLRTDAAAASSADAANSR